MKDLSSYKIVNIGPLIMCITKISGFMFLTTKAFFSTSMRFRNTKENLAKNVVRIFTFSYMPLIRMCGFYMFGIVLKQEKIFNSVISFYSIYMMDYFGFLEFSSKRFLHHIAMVKESFTINIDSKIAKFC